MLSPIINLSALEPLYLPHKMPEFHRIRAKREGEPAEIIKGRRTSEIIIAQNLRRYVSEWRDADYTGASDTTRELLHHWFERDHSIKNSEGESVPFRYYFCQREAIETFIFLREVRGLDTLSGIASFVANARIVYPQKRIFVCRDPKDNMLLDCCFAAGADILITGDKDILDIIFLPFDLEILTPKRFVEEA